MSRPKVLMLGWEFPPIINGGLGVACLGMAKAMSKEVDLSIILPKTDSEFIVDNVEIIGLNRITVEEIKTMDSTNVYKEFEDVSFIDTAILPYENYVDEGYTVLAEKQEVKAKKTEVKSEKEVFNFDELYGDDIVEKVQQYAKYALKIALQKDFDVIHAHDWMTFLAGVEIKKHTGKPLAVHVHSLSYDRSGPESRGWVYDLEKYGMEEADIVIPVSNYTGDIVVNHFGIDRGKVFPVHNGTDFVKPFEQEKPFTEKLVLFLGRITLQKGPEIFLEIASKVLSKSKNVRFVMAGTGDKLKRVIESGAYKNVGNKFHFTGFLDSDKVNTLLSQADVYCMPSVSEPFGLSALEAAQFGIPAVISKQSGVSEVLSGALKADFWDVDLMADHIISLLEDNELKDKVVQESYDNLRSLTWETAGTNIVSIFNNYLESN